MSSVHFSAILPNDHVRGNRNAKITMIEYGDYECSYCREAFPILESVISHYKSDIIYAFRNFPLTQIHPNAQAAAQAAEAAGLQGFYWEMHAKLFQSPDLNESTLVRLASSLGLDLHAFAEDFADAEVLQKIEDDGVNGKALGIQGTPAFFIDGKIFRGNWLKGDIETYIEAKLQAASASDHV